jgi:hypothetical protein
MAASQRPAALATLGHVGSTRLGSIPSWYMVAGRDNAIGTAAERIEANGRDQERLACGLRLPS